MDLQKLRVRKDLERMVINYFLRGEITEDQSSRICDYIDSTIGGGNYPKPGQGKKGSYIIPFPIAYTGKQPTDTPKETEQEAAERNAKREALTDIYAPYGEPLPEGVKDFRQVLQRDGLILICYEKLTSKEGTFFNVLWAQSNSNNDKRRRVTNWSGAVREEDIPYVMPLDVEYSSYYSKDKVLVYSVTVAPDNALSGPLSDYELYIKSLKAMGLRNSQGEKINLDYVYNFTAEKRRRYLEANKELIQLKLTTRIINALNERGIYRLAQMKNISIQEIQSFRNIGEATFNETIAILKEAGITLRTEKIETTDYGQMELDF